MAAAPAVPDQHVPDGEEEEDYESDDYDVEDDEGDADYQGDDGDEEEEDEGDEEDEEEGGKSLTALLVADPNQSAQVDEEDEGYAPPGETDPADEPIDGNARVPTGDPSETKGALSAVPSAVAAVGLKRKSSGDEDDEEDEDDEDELDAKKLKA
ncbi:hypothetical protein A7U60_g3816 [Sanghuangporus baumii]|uniref:Uncharacterized protein n=1 Tax=Sanghuangporus baumii TaxID=108892 RepID=A0A9Q5HZZ9_SANBA|nr:hypothetical protein A7U60_g3816 [Sanghuangporus baumii]